MQAFQWDGDTYPIPAGWSGLSIEEWYYKMATSQDRMMQADELGLEPMHDEDGDPLDVEEVFVIRELGFTSGGHWQAFRNWGSHAWGATTGESATDVEFRMGGIARERIMAEKAAAMGGPGGGMEPVEGVALEQWAHVQAGLAGGGDVDAMIAAIGVDRARWDRVSAEWMARMQSDTTMAIATAYGNAFSGAGQGQFGAQGAQAASQGVGGDVGAEPMPFERWCEIMEASSIAGERGQDANAVFAQFGISTVDWSNVSMYWNKRMQQESTKYYELYNHYSAHYRAQYGG